MHAGTHAFRLSVSGADNQNISLSLCGWSHLQLAGFTHRLHPTSSPVTNSPPKVHPLFSPSILVCLSVSTGTSIWNLWGGGILAADKAWLKSTRQICNLIIPSVRSGKCKVVFEIKFLWAWGKRQRVFLFCSDGIKHHNVVMRRSDH